MKVPWWLMTMVLWGYSPMGIVRGIAPAWYLSPLSQPSKIIHAQGSNSRLEVFFIILRILCWACWLRPGISFPLSLANPMDFGRRKIPDINPNRPTGPAALSDGNKVASTESLSQREVLWMLTTGGLELLCDSLKIHNVNVEPDAGEKKLIMKDLLKWVCTNLIKERPEMFMKGETVRPGVLVLVNDCDWELSGQLDTMLEEKDVVVFISTLHGG
ncbi:hypothetical protein RJ639_023427 [Escallonia herrerae]|uniref:Ubiquitin-related modifier 1 homolog n=1 Tax=Escallonia herrerae TaxID=1293975 RepID=A0AA89ACQ2_9ASTE|nr:hypothetical protein RJ639_023427 [Escallonia herrerae]